MGFLAANRLFGDLLGGECALGCGPQCAVAQQLVEDAPELMRGACVVARAHRMRHQVCLNECSSLCLSCLWDKDDSHLEGVLLRAGTVVWQFSLVWMTAGRLLGRDAPIDTTIG